MKSTSIGNPKPDDLISTGDAARMLGTSRQHVVDLCERGELPFVTVGTHRRVRESDVLALQSRTARMTRDQRRSLWQAYAVAGQIVENPEPILAEAQRNVERMKEQHIGQPLRWVLEWERLLKGPVEVLLRELVSPSPRSRELRQNTPFAGALDEHARTRVLEAFPTTKPKR